ncbi:MAG: lipopolysaccharide transport system permease protein [Candidatus Omnitrophota bacterium]
MIEKNYYPNRDLKLGIKVWKEMFEELDASKELIWRLFIRDFSVKYRQSFLGYLWAVILPFVTIGVFVYLNRNGVLNIGETDVPYPLFALIGLTVWQIFATGLNSGVNSLVAAGGMITKINFPREALIIASLAQSIFELLVKMGLVVIFCVFFQFKPQIGALLFPFAVIPLLCLTLGLSLLLSMLNALFRDTANTIMLLTTFLLFLTPTLYPLGENPSLFHKLNPLTALINAPRELIIYGTINNPTDFMCSSIFSVLILFIAWRIFHIVETKIPERL